MLLDPLKNDLKNLADLKRAEVSARFFKTGKGQYGQGDVFLGITVPKMRAVAKKYLDLTLGDIEKLLFSKIHEHRFVSLVILVSKFNKADEAGKRKIFDFYIKNARHVNNWDLVDTSAPYIVGEYLGQREKGVLYKFAKSKNLWERRIAIVSTYAFIRNNKIDDTLKIAEVLISDGHDLIHKAVGWMLREVGKKDKAALEGFLKKHYQKMPRTMLRYAIERFDLDKKRFYMVKGANSL